MEDKNTTKKKDGRGGARPGAGRPKGDKEQFSVRIGGKAAQMIKSRPNRSDFICDCIREHMEREEALVPDLTAIGHVMRPSSESQMIGHFDVRVACGTPAELPDNSVEMVDALSMICSDPSHSYVIETSGNSMIDADIHSGDMIVVDMGRLVPTPRRPMLCQLDGGYTVKFVELNDDGIVLVPANETFAPIEVEPGSDFHIWGTVMCVIHHFGR